MADKSNKKFWERTAKLYTYFQEKGNEELYKTIYEKIKPFFNKEQCVLEKSTTKLIQRNSIKYA